MCSREFRVKGKGREKRERRMGEKCHCTESLDERERERERGKRERKSEEGKRCHCTEGQMREKESERER